MSTAVTSRVQGIFQVRRSADNWIVIPIIYGSGLTYLPIEMSFQQVAGLFGACNLPKASLAQDSFIIEFERVVTTHLLSEFGFKTANLSFV